MRRVAEYRGEATYAVRVAGVERKLPIIPLGPVEILGEVLEAYIASDHELILGDVEFLAAAARGLAELIRPYRPEVLLAPEAKSIALAYGVARELGLPRFVVARKSVKAYMGGHIAVEVNAITTKEKQRLVLDRDSADYLRGRRVCLIDDVVSTGSTMRALEELAKAAGAQVACRAAIWVEGPWVEDDEVLRLGELPIFVKGAGGGI
ncbi:MAG: phosphoribosyltransferase family protein [Thermoproteus sp. AZ2]|uniref:Phosphoribosyltransferase family protein n=1 Tax=Thermoproteus sp. AZ2 TaxID=1609232 RepID=A0ACC6V0L4_9CREN